MTLSQKKYLHAQIQSDFLPSKKKKKKNGRHLLETRFEYERFFRFKASSKKRKSHVPTRRYASCVPSIISTLPAKNTNLSPTHLEKKERSESKDVNINLATINQSFKGLLKISSASQSLHTFGVGAYEEKRGESA